MYILGGFLFVMLFSKAVNNARTVISNVARVSDKTYAMIWFTFKKFKIQLLLMTSDDCNCKHWLNIYDEFRYFKMFLIKLVNVFSRRKRMFINAWSREHRLTCLIFQIKNLFLIYCFYWFLCEYTYFNYSRVTKIWYF